MCIQKVSYRIGFFIDNDYKSAAKLQRLCEQNKNANLFLPTTFIKGIVWLKGSHFFSNFASILIFNILYMETNYYQTKAKTLLDYMSKHNYCDYYISLFKRESEWLAAYLSSGGVYDDYLPGYCKRYGQKLYPNKLWAIKAIKRYFEEGVLPSRRHPKHDKATLYERLSESNRSYVDSYISFLGSGKPSRSLANVKSELSAFLLHIQLSGVALSDVTEDVIWSFFYDSVQNQVLHDKRISSLIRTFLRWLNESPDGECYSHIIDFVPAMKRIKKTFDCLTEEEDNRLISYVTGNSCMLSLRDKAIFIVARFCGLRASDIVALRITDIDLGHSRLSIRQCKTGVVLEQTLRPVVGNAICRYVMEERPMSDLPELFLVDDRDVRPLSPCTIGKVCDKVYRLVGVRQDGRRGGSHILRHRFAQSLIENGACDSTAMRLLGHSSPSSLNVYLDTDHKMLRSCALYISDFAIRKEVLE